jgi:hypothetical protein
VASQDITEAHLSDFRLVWRGLLSHFQNVFDNVWMLASMAPSVIVDGVRAAQLIDCVLGVRST